MKLATALASISLFAGVVLGKTDQGTKLANEPTASDKKKRDLGYYGGHYLDEEFCDLTGMYEVLESPVHADNNGDITSDGVARVSFVCYSLRELKAGYTDYGLPIKKDTFHRDTCNFRRAHTRTEEEQDFAGTSEEAMIESVNPEGLDLFDVHFCTFEAIGFPDAVPDIRKKERRELQPPPDGSGVPNYGIVVTATIDFGYGPICLFTQLCAVDLDPNSDTFENYVSGAKARDNLLQFGVWPDSHPFAFFHSSDYIAPFSAFKTSQSHSHTHYI